MNPDPLLVHSLGRTTSYWSAGLILTGLGVLASILLGLWFGDRAEQAPTDALHVSWIIAILLVGWGPLAAWCIAMRHYIRQVRWDAAAGQVELTLLGPLGGRVESVAPAAFADVVRREGKLAIPFRVQVNAPYHRIRTAGPVGTLVLDGQGTVHDAAALEAILGGRAPGS